MNIKYESSESTTKLSIIDQTINQAMRDTTHTADIFKNTITMILVLCLQVSVSLCQLPVTGISTASANTGTGFDTTLNQPDYRLFLSDELSTCPIRQFFINGFGGSQSNKEIKLFDKVGVVRASVNLVKYDTMASVILKDPLKLFVAGGSKQLYFDVTVSGSTYSFPSTTAYKIFRQFIDNGALHRQARSCRFDSILCSKINR